MSASPSSTRNEIQAQLAAHRALLDQVAAGPYAAQTAELAERLIAAYRRGGKLIIMGNGGSAADAQHVAAEMVARFKRERPAWPALALHGNTSTLTAIGNDYTYDDVYSRQMEAFAAAGDVVIGLSTSGNSRNVLAALRVARARGAWTAVLTGAGGGAAGQVADLCLAIPSRDTPRVQEMHITLLHIVCDLVEASLTEANPA